MPRFPQRFWLAALLVAWSVDFLFWQKPAGISFVIFIGLTLLGAFLLSRAEGVRPHRLSLLMGGLALVFSLVTIWRTESFTRFLNGFVAVCAIALLVVTFRSGAWVRFRLVDYLTSGISLLVAGLTGGAGLRLLPEEEPGKPGQAALRRSLPVLRGVALALPVVFILGALLSSADLIFAKQVKNFFDFFQLERLPEYILRFIYILFLAYVFVGLYRYAIATIPWMTPKEKAPAAEGEAVPTASRPGEFKGIGQVLGSTEAFIILGAVNLMFAFFVAIQFRYLFGGQANITAAGYTYSEYARKGFFELVMVAVLSLLLYLGLSSLTRRATSRAAKWFTGLSALLVALVLVILVSAFQRLLLYEGAYGFTNLRMYTHIFIPWLGFLLVATIILQILRREAFFSALLIFTIAGFTLTFAFLNVDALIARLNVDRARAGAELDGPYLLSLSEDAYPVLVKAYQQAGQPENVRDVVGGVLACKQQSLRDDDPPAWQAYHPGAAFDRSRLFQLDLSQYNIQTDRDGTTVTLTSGQTMNCAPVANFD